MNQPIIIRKGKTDDLAQVYRLVIELAIYEKEPQAVTATLADYHRDFQEGVFDLLVAEKDGEIIGMMIYYMSYSTWKGKMMYLEDFVIQQAHRRSGVGQLLYDAFLVESEKANAKLVKWQVLDWNEPAIRFYQKNNAIIEKNWFSVKQFL